MSKIIGIDLGTTNSCAGLIENDRLIIIPNDENFRTTPSVVGFTKEGTIVVGNAAKRQQLVNSDNTVFSIKRFIGRKLNDPDVAKDVKLVPYKLVAAPNGDVRVELSGKTYSPPEISAMILRKIKKDAEAFLNEKVDKAVVTVPAYFNDSQKKATKDAGRIAGLDVVRIINEPTAAAMSCGLDPKKNMKVVIYDLGGGTFDVSILQLGNGVFRVISTSGDTHLGGDDFDQRIIDYLVAEFYKTDNIDLRSNRVALQRLKDAAEKAKINLSDLDAVEITLQYIAATSEGPRHLKTMLTRQKLEEVTRDLAEATAVPCQNAMRQKGLRPQDIDEVVLIGGQTKMPLVREVVLKIFGKEPNSKANPDEAVAAGAARQAGIIKGDVRDIILLDITPFSLGIKIEGGLFSKIIEAGTSIPARKEEIYSTAKDDQAFIKVEVYQGDKPMAADNKMIGTFEFVGIAAAPKGVPKIAVAFDVDANGIIKVSAKDQATGKVQEIEIKPDSGLSNNEVEKMTKDISSEFDKKFSKTEKTQVQDFSGAQQQVEEQQGLPAEADDASKKSIFDIFKKKG